MRQFSTRSMLLFVSYVAVVVAVSQMVSHHMRIYQVGLPLLYPGWLGFFSLAAILMTCVCAIFDSDTTSGWRWLNLAWVMVSANLAYGTYLAFFVNSTPSRERYQEGLNAALISTVPIVFLLTLPIAYSLIRNSTSSFTFRGFWNIAPSIVAITDTLLVWLLASASFGTLLTTGSLY